MLIAIKPINNRFDKRMVDKEKRKNAIGLLEIETYFLRTAYKDKDNYNQIFNFFNDEYRKHCKRISIEKKWIYTIPNPDWFENRYKDFDKTFDKLVRIKEH